MKPAALWLMKTCLTFPMEITKEGAQSLRMKMPNAQCIWKKLRLFTALPACSKIARTNVKVGKSRLLALVELRAQELAFNLLLVGWAMIRNCWGSIRWEDRSRRYQARERYYTACKCCLSIFTKIKLFIKNRDSSMVFSVALLLKYNFCLRNIFLYILMSFIEEFARLSLFHYVFSRNIAKLIIFLQFLHYCSKRWSDK